MKPKEIIPVGTEVRERGPLRFVSHFGRTELVAFRVHYKGLWGDI